MPPTMRQSSSSSAHCDLAHSANRPRDSTQGSRQQASHHRIANQHPCCTQQSELHMQKYSSQLCIVAVRCIHHSFRAMCAYVRREYRCGWLYSKRHAFRPQQEMSSVIGISWSVITIDSSRRGTAANCLSPTDCLSVARRDLPRAPPQLNTATRQARRAQLQFHTYIHAYTLTYSLAFHSSFTSTCSPPNLPLHPHLLLPSSPPLSGANTIRASANTWARLSPPPTSPTRFFRLWSGRPSRYREVTPLESLSSSPLPPHQYSPPLPDQPSTYASQGIYSARRRPEVIATLNRSPGSVA
ncbi:unnamed protein product [Periconia digitata]|uniref:Uncharacterized protein n=1 Tax=Periconia digitata TaxID=1303443 RepID=A0A9W4XGB4_9PLEO|nr:unnamed protein product [Periconia digitata]